MPILKKRQEKLIEKETPKEFKKLSLFITVVPHSIGEPVMNLFKSLGVSAQYLLFGEGTADKDILDILGISDNRKDVVLTIIKEESVPEATKELEAFFKVNKKNRGVGCVMPMSSIIGMKVYSFLSDTL